MTEKAGDAGCTVFERIGADEPGATAQNDLRALRIPATHNAQAPVCANGDLQVSMSSDSNALEKLISVGSDGLCPGADVPATDGVLEQLWNLLLRRKNGFYAYERALLVRPLSAQSNVLGVIEWNSDDGWKGEYNLDLSAHLFFAENIFGEQFSFTGDGIFFFEPETAKLERMAANLEAWAALIAADPSQHLGHALARKWQRSNGSIQPGERLGPKMPFVVGGEFVPDNLARMRDAALMSFRAQLANQITDLLDGAEIKINLIK